MKPKIDEVQRRVQRYWYDDGLTEIAVGCIFVLIGLLFLAEALAKPGTLPASFSAIGLPVVLIGGGWVARWIIRAVKERVTYPRTGYVSYRRPQKARSRVLTGAVAMFMAILVALLFASVPASLAWIPVLQGMLIGGFLLYMGRALDLFRFYVVAILSVLFGALASLGGLGDTLGSATYFGATGVTLIASGSLTLWSYLRQTRPPTEG